MSNSALDLGNKRIAKNTIVVYFRLFVTTIIGLISSRLVLQSLGVSDYGLYNIVGGILAFFTILSGSLSGTTIRFLNFEIGRTDGNPNKVFNTCNVLHLIFAILIFFLAETIGVFYIRNYLNVDVGKEADAMFVFQVSTIVACIGVTNVPFQSVLIAKEQFFLLAIIDIINAVVKLILVILLLYFSGNKLRLYSFFIAITTLISFIAYHCICYKHWPELVKWKFCNRFKEYKDLLVFNNYNLLASVSLLGRSQGSNVLINYFFGTVVNGAYGIARTVQGFVEIIASNFDQASAPQITQSVGNGNLERASSLANTICRYCQLITMLVVFPLFVETDFLLGLWLGTVPNYSVSFCRLVLLAMIVASTGGGFLRLKDALGNIKWFMISYSFWYLLTLPLGFIFFKSGYPPETILVLYIISDFMSRISQLILMRIVYGFDVNNFCLKAYPRPIIVLTAMFFYCILYNQIHLTGMINHIVGLMITALTGLFLVLIVGLNQHERDRCFAFLSNKILHRLN